MLTVAKDDAHALAHARGRTQCLQARTVEVWCNRSSNDPVPNTMRPALLLKAPVTVSDLSSKMEGMTGMKFHFFARSSKSTKLRGSALCPTVVLAEPSSNLNGGMLNWASELKGLERKLTRAREQEVIHLFKRPWSPIRRLLFTHPFIHVHTHPCTHACARGHTHTHKCVHTRSNLKHKS